MSNNNKRKRAVVLALIAFFCGATTFVSVDWKRFGGGFLAFFKPKSEPLPTYAGGSLPSGGGTLGGAGDSHVGAAALPPLVALGARRHANSIGGPGGHKSDENLFKYGDPAAGGIPPGSFLVAQNDTAGSGNAGAGTAAPEGGAAPETAVNPGSGDSGDSGSGGVSSPAPAPAGTGGGGDGGILFPSPTPSPSAAPTPPVSPPIVSPPTSTPPAPTPTQSGTNDQGPGNGGGDLPPVSAVPEASGAAMMGLGALFLAVAATRRRKNDQA